MGMKWEERGWDTFWRQLLFWKAFVVWDEGGDTHTKEAEPLLQSTGHFVH